MFPTTTQSALARESATLNFLESLTKFCDEGGGVGVERRYPVKTPSQLLTLLVAPGGGPDMTAEMIVTIASPPW